MLDARKGILPLDKALEVFRKYEDATPLALLAKVMTMRHFNLDNSTDIKELKKAGNYNFILAASAKLEFFNTGIIDHEVFCEAYFNGCDMYEFKNEKKIMCEK